MGPSCMVEHCIWNESVENANHVLSTTLVIAIAAVGMVANRFKQMQKLGSGATIAF